MPFIAGRIAGAARIAPKIAEQVDDGMAEIRKFLVDIALSGNPSALAAPLAVADPSRLTFGSNFPYATGLGIRANLVATDRYSIDKRILAAIGRGNAARLLGREASGAARRWNFYGRIDWGYVSQTAKRLGEAASNSSRALTHLRTSIAMYMLFRGKCLITSTAQPTSSSFAVVAREQPTLRVRSRHPCQPSKE